MEIDITRIPIDNSPEEIKDFIQSEILTGKLANWRIKKIEMQLPTKENEFPGLIYLSESGGYPKLFTILKKDSEENKYILSMPIQKNY